MAIVTRIGTFLSAKYRGVLPLLAILLFWSAVTRFGLVSSESLPPPAAIGKKFLELLRSGMLGKSLGMSLLRIAQGFFLGTALGFLLGAAMGVSRTAERLFAPLINALRQVPIIGWIPLIILWCGIQDMSKIIFIAIGAFFPMVLSTFEGVRTVPHAYVEVVRVFEYGRLGLLRTIILPGALPSIVSGVRLSLGTSWLLVVWSEINTRSSWGIGDMLWSARESSQMDVVIVCMIVIGLVAFLINKAIEHFEIRLQGWKKTFRQE